jgi:hypothetical protein
MKAIQIRQKAAAVGSDCEQLCGGNGKHHAVAERLC